jgi:hypothetical protein
MDATWQADLLDMTQHDARVNHKIRYALLCVDVFSRHAWAALLRTKRPTSVAKALGAIFARATPRVLHTDGGAEFQGSVTRLLAKFGVLHVVRHTSQRNALAVVDATIRTIKLSMAKAMAAEDDEAWAPHLLAAVRAYTGNAHSALLGSTPADARTNPALQRVLRARAGTDAAHNARLHARRYRALREAGLARQYTTNRTGRRRRAMHAVYNDAVLPGHFDPLGQRFVVGGGVRLPLSALRPVPRGSRPLRLPRSLRPRIPGVDAAATEALQPFVEDLRAMLQGGPLRFAALRAVAAVPAQRLLEVYGLNAERLARLFPVFGADGGFVYATDAPRPAEVLADAVAREGEGEEERAFARLRPRAEDLGAKTLDDLAALAPGILHRPLQLPMPAAPAAPAAVPEKGAAASKARASRATAMKARLSAGGPLTRSMTKAAVEIAAKIAADLAAPRASGKPALSGPRRR